jgi:hypothetical protein
MKWEYYVQSEGIGPTEIEEACSESGENGWELVTVIVVEATPEEWRTRLIYKRPKSEPSPS